MLHRARSLPQRTLALIDRALSRLPTRGRHGAAARPATPRLRFETMEPRLLMSADIVPSMQPEAPSRPEMQLASDAGSPMTMQSVVTWGDFGGAGITLEPASAGAAFVESFGVEGFNTPLQPLAPRGSLVYAGGVQGTLVEQQTSELVLQLAAGQTLSLRLRAQDPALQLQLEIVDVNGQTQGFIAAGQPGEAVSLQVSSGAGGATTLRVASLLGAGGYTLEVFLGAALEGSDSTGMADATDLNALLAPVPGGIGQRASVIGAVSVPAAPTAVASESFEQGIGASWELTRWDGQAYFDTSGYSRLVNGQWQSNQALYSEGDRYDGSGGGGEMGAASAGDYADNLNEAVLTLDLTGRQNLVLDFDTWGWDPITESFPEGGFTGSAFADGVAISADGGSTWYALGTQEVTDWYGEPYTAHYTLDLSAALAAHGLVAGTDFKIKFQHADAPFYWNDGSGNVAQGYRWWDNIVVSEARSLRNAPVTGVSASAAIDGSLDATFDGHTPAEGQNFYDHRSAHWSAGEGDPVQLVFDLGDAVLLSDLRLSLDGNDVYGIDVSLDGQSWQSLITVGTGAGEHYWGFDTLSTVEGDAEYDGALDFAAVPARYLRVSGLGSNDGLYAVGEVRALTAGAADVEDWYRIDLAAGERASVALQFAQASLGTGDASLELYAADGTRLTFTGAGAGAGADLGIAGFQAPEDGSYYLRVSAQADTEYNLAVTRGAALGSAAAPGAPQDITATPVVVDSFVEAADGNVGAIRVAVVGSDSALVARLDASTRFDIDAVNVTGNDVDTVAELSAFDVVIIGDDYTPGYLDPMAPALRQWVEAGGGLVATGWTVYAAGSSTWPVLYDIDAVVPVDTTGSYNYNYGGTLDVLAPAHPVLAGLDDFQINGVYIESSPLGADPGAEVLARLDDGSAVVVAGQPGNGRSVYLGPNYASAYDNFTSPELDRLLEQSIAWAAGEASRVYEVRAVAGDALTVTLERVGGSAGEQPGQGGLPLLELLSGGGTGTVLASSASGTLAYSVPGTGAYAVRVVSQGEPGSWVLRVQGSSAAAPASFGVTGSSIDALTRTTEFPYAVELGFDTPLLLSSLHPGALTANGVGAAWTEILAPDRVRFHFGIDAVNGDGSYVLALADGALTDIHGAALAAWSHTFALDTTLPVVVASSIEPLGTTDGEPAVLRITFSEDLDPEYLDSSDAVLSNRAGGQNISFTSFSYDAATRTLELGLPALPDGAYQVQLFSGFSAFKDLLGLPLNGSPSGTLPSGQGDNSADDFVLSFSVDRAPTSLAGVELPPLGALVHGSTASGSLYGNGDVDGFLVTLEQSALLSVGLQQSGSLDGLRLRLSVVDAGGNLVAEALGEPGGQLQLQALGGGPLAAGTYRVDVESLQGSGAYTVSVAQQAVVEDEALGAGADNGTRAGAQDLAPSRLQLAEGIDRLAAVGRLAAGDTEWYAFTLEAGRTASVALALGGSASVADLGLALFDASGDLATGSGAQLAGAVAGAQAQQAILDFTNTAGATATYYLRVNGGSAAPYALVVTRGAAFSVGLRDAVQPLGPTGAVIGHSAGGVGIGNGSNDTDTFYLELNDGAGWNWEIERAGNILDGTSDAYDGGLYFNVADVNSGANANFHADQGRLDMQGRQLVLADSPLSGIQATRKVNVAADKPYARFLDSVTNTGSQARTLDLRINTNLGSDSGTFLIATQSGDTAFNAQDRWLVTDDSSNGGGDPSMAHVIWGEGGTAPTSASLGGDSLQYSWRVTLAPGQTVSLLHFAVQAGNRSLAAAVAQQIDAMGFDDMLAGLSNAELRSVINREPEAGELYSFQAGAGDEVQLDLQALQGVQLPLRLLVTGPGEDIVLDTGEATGPYSGLGASFVAAQAGAYRVEVLTGTQDGAYLLRVSGNTGADTVPRVVAATPAQNAVLSVVPQEIVLQLSEAVRADSVSADDLQLSAGSVTGVQLLAGDRVRFLVDVPSAEGPLDYGLAEGAFTDLQGHASAAHSGRFIFDLQGPRVTAATPAADAGAPFNSWTFTFSEALDPGSVSTADIAAFTGPSGQDLRGQINSVSVSGNVLTVYFNNQWAAGSYAMTLGPDIRDLPGNAMDQDGDNVRGEVVEDRFTAGLTLRSPDLVPVSITTSAASGNFGSPISVTWTVRNAGTEAARQNGWYDRLVLSRNDVFGDGDDVYLNELHADVDPLAPDTSYTRTLSVTPPIDVNLASGEYRVLVRTDYYGNQGENDEGNNALASEVVTLSVPALPDLTVENVTAPTLIEAGKPVTLNWTVRNQGTAITASGWYDRVYLSTDAVYSSGDLYVDEFYNGTAIAAGGTLARSASITLPASRVGDWYLVVRSDIYDAVEEHDRENNNNAATAAPVTVLVPTQDLVPQAVSAPVGASFGQSINVQWTVRNAGTGPTIGNWTDRLWLSTDATLGNDIYLGEFSSSGDTPLAAGAAYQRARDVTLPFNDGLAAGTYRVLVQSDHYGSEPESSESNNVAASAAITLSVPPTPDLTVSNVVAPTGARSGDTVQVRFTLTNQGTAAASNFHYRLSLTDDGAAPGSQDHALGSFLFNDTLDAGESVEVTQTVTLPIGAPGSWYVGVTADSSSQIYEYQREGNNSALSALTSIPLPPLADLVVTNITAPLEALAGQQVPISWTIANQGTRSISGGAWMDRVYLSTDNGGTDGTLVGSFAYEGDLAAGASVTRTQFITLPANQAGNYTLVVRTDANSQHYEHAGENNNRRVDNTVLGVTLPPQPNLQVTAITPPTGVASSVATTVSWVVSNTGTGSTSAPTWWDEVYLSLNDVVGDGDDILVGTVANPSYLAAGDSYASSLSFTVPRGLSGDYRVLVRTDVHNQVFEYQAEGDNTRASDPVRIALTPPPDLQVQLVNAPAQAFSGQPMTLAWTVLNAGDGRTLESGWYDRIVMSADAVLDGGDHELGRVWHAGALNAGASYGTSQAFTLPVGVFGEHYFFVVADSANHVYEHVSENNNAGFDTVPTNVLLTPPPDLEVDVVTVPASARAGGTLTVQFAVTNYGATATAENYWVDKFWLSADDVLDAGDLLLETRGHGGVLAVDGSYGGSVNLALPNTVAAGSYRVIVHTDANAQVFEGVAGTAGNPEANNVRASAAAVVVANTPANLVVDAFTAPNTGESGKQLAVSWTVRNAGSGATQISGWNDRVMVSRDEVIGDDDDFAIHTEWAETGLAVGGTYTISALATLPFSMDSGSYRLYVRADADGRVYEGPAGEGDNTAAKLLAVTRVTPDLRVSSITPPAGDVIGGPLTLSWRVDNQGANRTDANHWTDQVWLSADAALGSGDVLLGSTYRGRALAGGEGYDASASFALPASLAAGQYHLIVRTDAGAEVTEGAGEGNNVTATVGTVLVAPVVLRPDLTVSEVDAAATAYSGQPLQVTWTVRNDGVDPTGNVGWYDAVYLSTDLTFDRGSDVYLGYADHAGGLAAGASYSVTRSFTVPQGLSGPFYVFVAADSGRQLAEVAEANNSAADSGFTQVSLAPPADLVAGTVTLPANAVPGMNATLGYSITNQSSNTALGHWRDSIYLSSDDTWDIGDLLFGSVERSGPLAAGASYSASLTAALPGVAPGDYRVIVRSDILNTVAERSEANNVSASVDAMDVDMQVLQLGTAQAGTLAAGQSAFYKIVVGAGETVRVTLEGTGVDLGNELYLRRGAMPTRGVFDQAGRDPFEPDQVAVIPTTEAGTYYVLVHAASGGGAHAYSIQAEVLPFSLQAVDRAELGNAGPVTLRIDGAKFDAATLFTLAGAAGATLAADAVFLENSSVAYVTFDTRGAALGAWTLKATAGNGTVATWGQALRIVEGQGVDVVARVTGPAQVRPGRTIVAELAYANQGDADTMAPIFIVSSPTGTAFGTTVESIGLSSSVLLLGVGSGGAQDVLRAGDENSVPLLFNAVNAPMRFTTRIIESSSNEALDFALLEHALRMPGLTDAQWSARWLTQIQPRLGETWGDYVRLVNALSQRFSAAGHPIQDVRELFARAFTEDADFVASTSYTATLRDAVSGEAMAGVAVAAYRQTSNGLVLARATTTDAGGAFSLRFLTPGTYTLALARQVSGTDGQVELASDYFFDQNRNGLEDSQAAQFTITAGDLTGDVIYAAAYPAEQPLAGPNDAAPVVASDSAGRAHMVWLRDGQLWHAVNDGSGWRQGAPIPGAEGYDLQLVADPRLINGDGEGLLAAWRSGDGNEAEIWWAVGQRQADGSYRWSVPAQLTDNAQFDGAYAVGVGTDGRPAFVFQREDAAIEDDLDLYSTDLSVVDPVMSATLVEQYAALADALSLYSDAELEALGIHRIRFGRNLGNVSFGPLGTFDADYRVDAQAQIDCTLIYRANGALKLKIGSLGEFEGVAGGDVRYQVNKDQCVYEFKNARINFGVSGAINVPLTFIPVVGAVLESAGLRGRVEGSLGGSMVWEEGSDFPGWWTRGQGNLRFSLGVNLERSVTVWGQGLKITGRVLGNANGVFDERGLRGANPTFSVSALVRVEMTVLGQKTYLDWTGTWPATDVGPLGGSLIGEDAALFAANDYDFETSFSFGGQALGTRNVYTDEGETNLTDDLVDDDAPVIVEDASGALHAAWTGAQGVMVAARGDGAWGAATAIPGTAGHANSGVALAFDGSGDLLAVWTRIDTSAMAEADTSDEVEAIANRGGDLVFARRDAATGQWSAPQLLSAADGREGNVRLLRTADGNVAAAWTTGSLFNATGQGAVNAATWDAAANAWSAPQTVATGRVASSAPVLVEVGGRPTLLYTVSSTSGATVVGVLMSSSWSGSAWSAGTALSIALQAALVDTASASSAGSIGDTTSMPAPGGTLTPMGLPLPAVPEYCCDDEEDPPPYDPEPVVPRDPNDILGPKGFGEQNWIGAGQTLGYTIRFENAADAAAPAQEVVITQQLDADLDWRTFRVDDFGFGDQRIELGANSAFHQVRLDYSATRGYVLDVSVSIDVATGIATWRLATLDPATGELPQNAQLGFLPANVDEQGNKDGRGEGFVSYTVKAKRTVATGTVIDAQARIVFDTEEPIDTPPIFHTLDAGLPESAVQALPARSDEPIFMVSWLGDDEANGSAVGHYDVFVSINGGEWRSWLSDTTLTQAQFTGERGLRYAFYSVATDNAGNTEAAPAEADAVTEVSPGTGAITGLAFDDADGDGVYDAGEGALQGWTVFLDADDDGVLDAGERSTTTADDGSYAFTGVAAGSTVVGRVMQAGWVGTAPVGERQPVTVTADATTGNVRFGSFRLGAVSGVQFSDLDADGVRDAGEAGLAGWTVLLDRNGDGSTDATTTTAADGSYRFDDLGPGAWRVSMQTPAGWLATAPASGRFDVTMSSGLQAGGRDFGAVQAASIAGLKYEDVDGDGQRDAGEAALQGWTIFLDADADGVLDAGERSTVTGADGSYRFDGLLPGSYTVAEVMQPGWMQTAPGTGTAAAALQVTGSGAALALDDVVLEGDALQPAAVSGNAWAGMLSGLQALHADARFAGLDGRGVTTVVIDTGIDLDHAFFGADADHDGVADRIAFQWDFADNDADASDRQGHGSHIASLVGSQDATWAGVAPGADLIALKVFSDSGRGTFGYLESALQWVVAHADEFGVGVVNLSLGDGGNWGEAIGRYGLGDELAALAAHDIIVTAAAGNGFARFGGAWGVAYPGADPSVLAVGATWVGDLGGPWSFSGGATDYATGADRIASFSQRDDELLDVFAPGARLVGANASGGISTMQGTSQAAAYMAGVATLAQDLALQSLGRRLSLAEFDALLDATADRIADGDDENDNVRNSGLSFGRVDVLALAEAILALDAAAPGGTGGGEAGGGGAGAQPQAGAVAHSVTVAAGEHATDLDFGNFRLGRIEGQVFHDLDADGAKDELESGAGLSGWSVFIDADADGSLDLGESSTTTDASGAFAFADLGPGTRRVVMVPPTGWAGVTTVAQVAITSGAVATPALGANALPTLDEVAAQVLDEGSLLSLQLAGGDGAGDTLRYSLVSGPEGASVDEHTGLLRWNAADGDATHGFTVRVTDAAGSTAERSFNVQVRNVAPTLQLSGSASVQAGQAYLLGLASQDPGADAITGWEIDWGDGTLQTVAGNPSGVSHTYAAAGSYQVRATATDEDGSHEAVPHALQVTPAPVLLGAIAGQLYHDLDADGVRDAGEDGTGLSGISVFLDADGDGSLDDGELATATDAGGAFAFASLSPGERRVVVAAPAGWTAVAGAASVNVAAGATAPVALGLNARPVLAEVAAQTLDEGATLQVQLAGGDSAGDTLRYSLVSGPAGATLDTDTGVLRWRAADGWSQESFRVRVTDRAGGSAERSFSVLVNDVAPALQLTGNASVEAGQPYALGLAVNDPGTDTVTGWVIDWGDGIQQHISGNPSSVSHSYAAAGAYTVLATASDEDGSYLAVPHAVQVRAAPLRVDSFAATATGFKLRFNAAFDESKLNLVDGQGFDFGASDIVFRDAAGKAVAGSVAVDADRRGLTFVKTGGVLAAGRYGVQLLSGAKAFTTLDGLLLDGNRDGTAGDAYQHSFDVAATASAVLSLGEVARGPGQPIDLPASGTVGLPVTLTGAAGATRIAFTLRYDPALLTVTGAVNGAGLPSGSAVSVDLTVAGEARVVVTAGSALGGTALELLRLQSSVRAAAPYGARQVLDLADVAITRANGSAIAARDDDGLHVVAYIGDLNGNGTYELADVTLLQRVINRQDSGFGAWPLVDPVLLGDVNPNGALNSLDGTRLLQKVSGANRPEFPAVTVPADQLVRYSPNGGNSAQAAGVQDTSLLQRAQALQAEALAQWQAPAGGTLRMSGGIDDFGLGSDAGASPWLQDWLAPDSAGTGTKKTSSLRLTPNRPR